MPPVRQLIPRLQIFAAALLFSTGGALIKSCTLSSWQVAGFRSGIAAVALLAMLPAARRGWTWTSVWVGAAYAATLILFVQGNKLTTAANTIFLQSTAPLYILLLGPWILDEPVRRRDIGFMAVLAVGLSLFFIGIEPSSTTAPEPLRGNLVAAASGIAWALTVIGLRWIGRGRDGASTSALPAVVLGNLIAFAVCVGPALPLPDARLADWLILAYLGVFQIGLAYVFLTAAIRHLGALETALLLLLEPVLNPIWAWLVHGEHPGAWSLAGSAIILGATAAKSIVDLRGSARAAAAARLGAAVAR